jgi:hypothetical protein
MKTKTVLLVLVAFILLGFTLSSCNKNADKIPRLLKSQSPIRVSSSLPPPSPASVTEPDKAFPYQVLVVPTTGTVSSPSQPSQTQPLSVIEPDKASLDLDQVLVVTATDPVSPSQTISQPLALTQDEKIMEIIKDKASVVCKLLEETKKVADMVYKDAIINARVKLITNDDKKELVSWADETANVFYYWKQWIDWMKMLTSKNGDIDAAEIVKRKRYLRESACEAEEAKGRADGFYDAAKKQIDDLENGKITLKAKEGFNEKQETDRKNRVIDGWKKLQDDLIPKANKALDELRVYIKANATEPNSLLGI